MKSTVFVVLSCLCLYGICENTQQRDEVWGNINVRQIGSESVNVPSVPFQVKTHTFTFPRVRM